MLKNNLLKNILFLLAACLLWGTCVAQDLPPGQKSLDSVFFVRNKHFKHFENEFQLVLKLNQPQGAFHAPFTSPLEQSNVASDNEALRKSLEEGIGAKTGVELEINHTHNFSTTY